MITAMMAPKMDRTIFSREQRWDQLRMTIRSVQTKIPNSKIVLVEGGTISSSEIEQIQAAVDSILIVDVRSLYKTPGEATLLDAVLKSDYVQSQSIANLIKVSGRYVLDERFDWNRFSPDQTGITLLPKCWSGHPAYLTRFFKIPREKIARFQHGLRAYLSDPNFNRPFPDMEHLMYIFEMVDPSNIQPLPYLGISGQITGDGSWVHD